jgi:hypothetical protein
MRRLSQLSQNRLVATHYGFYNTIVGLASSLMQAARSVGITELTWLALGLVGVLAAFALHRLDRAGYLQPVRTTPSTMSR